METIAELMEGAGLSSIFHGGASDASAFMTKMMSKQKHQENPYSRQHIKKPFQYDKVDNPSKFIQVKYGEEPYKKFDACKAQKRANQKLNSEVDKVLDVMGRDKINIQAGVRTYLEEEAVRKSARHPSFWGMTWDDFKQEGNWLVNQQGMRFPPIGWKEPSTGKLYWGLPCCGATPEGLVAVGRNQRLKKNQNIEDLVNRNGQPIAKPRQKINYEMLWFREGYAPTNLPTHFDTRQSHQKVITKHKTYDDVELLGTNAVKKRVAKKTHNGHLDTSGIKTWKPAEATEEERQEIANELQRQRGRYIAIVDELVGSDNESDSDSESDSESDNDSDSQDSDDSSDSDDDTQSTLSTLESEHEEEEEEHKPQDGEPDDKWVELRKKREAIEQKICDDVLKHTGKNICMSGYREGLWTIAGNKEWFQYYKDLAHKLEQEFEKDTGFPFNPKQVYEYKGEKEGKLTEGVWNSRYRILTRSRRSLKNATLEDLLYAYTRNKWANDFPKIDETLKRMIEEKAGRKFKDLDEVEQYFQGDFTKLPKAPQSPYPVRHEPDRTTNIPKNDGGETESPKKPMKERLAEKKAEIAERKKEPKNIDDMTLEELKADYDKLLGGLDTLGKKALRQRLRQQILGAKKSELEAYRIVLKKNARVPIMKKSDWIKNKD